MDREYARQILAQTRQCYDAISKSFSDTRAQAWRQVGFLVSDYVRSGDRVLDAGCGNGRWYPVFRDRRAAYTGLDNSEQLINIAKNQFPGANFSVGDVLQMPFGGASFDKVYSIAVLHHIPSLELRRQFFTQAKRVLKPGGYLMVTAWNLDPARMLFFGRSKRFSAYIRALIAKLAGRSKLDFGDFFIPWRADCQRYVHSYSAADIAKLARDSGFVVEKSGVAGGMSAKESNIYLVARNPGETKASPSR